MGGHAHMSDRLFPELDASNRGKAGLLWYFSGTAIHAVYMHSAEAASALNEIGLSGDRHRGGVIGAKMDNCLICFLTYVSALGFSVAVAVFGCLYIFGWLDRHGMRRSHEELPWRLFIYFSSSTSSFAEQAKVCLLRGACICPIIVSLVAMTDYVFHQHGHPVWRMARSRSAARQMPLACFRG
jgi:hypothetical protein